MTRMAIKLIIFLLLGAVTTVAVAWGCAWFVDLTRMQPQVRTFPLPGRVEGPLAQMEGVRRIECQQFFVAPGAFRIAWNEGIRFDQTLLGTAIRLPYDSHSKPLNAPEARSISWCFRDSMPPDPIMHVSDARGWPMLALCAGVDLVPAGGGCRDVSRTYGAAAVMEPDGIRWLDPSVDYKQKIIPACPIFPGFAINTLFYAGILSVLWSTPFAARRIIRRRRGRCTRCGYDLRHAEHDACPECGNAWKT